MSAAKIVARIRLCGGMILMLYVICHLSNLSLGLWSLRLMDLWRPVITSKTCSSSVSKTVFGRFLASQVNAVFRTIVSSQARGCWIVAVSSEASARMQASCTISSASARLPVSQRASP
jgi:hypothetical protein